MKPYFRIVAVLFAVVILGVYLIDLPAVLSGEEGKGTIFSPPEESGQTRSGEPAKEEQSEPAGPIMEKISFQSVDKLDAFYDERELELDDLFGDTYILLETFPEDFPGIRRVQRKKELFHRIMLPHIKSENRRISKLRDRALGLKKELKNDGTLGTADETFLREQLSKYKITDDTAAELTEKRLDDLLHRLDVIPSSLVLAQAANESGWGTSRFTHRANNIFGEWTYNLSEGIKPRGVDESADFRVKVFSGIQDSLRSYMRNLNTNAAYQPFRELRARHRESMDSLKLVRGLEKYSSRGEEYIEAISSMIRHNEYKKFDRF